MSASPAAASPEADEIGRLASALRHRAPSDAFVLLDGKSDTVIASALSRLDNNTRAALLERYSPARRALLIGLEPQLAETAAPSDYPESTVGRLMATPVAIFPAGIVVEEAVARVRELARQHLVTYGYVVDELHCLLGVVTMRDLLLAAPGAKLSEVMLAQPFSLRPAMTVEAAMRETARRHYPLYPVIDDAGRLVGTVSGAALFEAQAFEISAQSGRMVGVAAAERLLTPWLRSLRLRHPWLQVNLVTAFATGFVVSMFESTVSRIVLLAAFLPIVAGQTGNTSSQTLAMTLRGIALNEYRRELTMRLLRKEIVLGFWNGLLVGLIAAVAMFAAASYQHEPQPLMLAAVVLIAMTGAAVVGGIAGVFIPLILMRFGADPATASAIFLSTVTDITSMGFFLWLATTLVL